MENEELELDGLYVTIVLHDYEKNEPVFGLGLHSKDRNLFMNLRLTGNQLAEIVSEIESWLAGSEKVNKTAHIDHVELLYENDGRSTLDIGQGEVFVTLAFRDRDCVVLFLDKIKQAILEVKVNINKVAETNEKNNEQEERYDTIMPSSEEVSSELLHYMQSNSDEEIVGEIVKSFTEAYPPEKLAQLKRKTAAFNFHVSDFITSKGFRYIDFLFRTSSNERGRRIVEKVIDVLEEEYQKSEEILLNILTNECIEFAKTNGKSKLRKSDIEEYLLRRKTKPSTRLKVLLYKKVNKML